MTTTPATVRACNLARICNRVLGKSSRSAAWGWDVRNDSADGSAYITLNYPTPEADRDAYTKIEKATQGRYDLDYTQMLKEYDWLPEEYQHCGMVTVRRITTPAAQEAPAMTTPAPADDTVTLRVPAAVARLWDSANEDQHASLDAADRDMAAAWATAEQRRHGKNGTVRVFTTTRTLAAAFLLSLQALCEAEFDSDNADIQGARAGLAMVQRYADKGLTPNAPADDYRMINPADQAALEADQAAHDARDQQEARKRTEAASHRAAWKSLTREERAARTQTILDAASAVLGVQRPGTRTWLDLGSVTATISDGRLYMEARRLADPAAQPALDAARSTLEAAGWTVSDYGRCFYAQEPQEAATAPQEDPAAVAARLLHGLTVTTDGTPGTHRVVGNHTADDGTVTLTLTDADTDTTFTATLDATAVTPQHRAEYAARVKAHPLA